MINIVNQNDINRLIKADKIFHRIFLRYGAPPNWLRPQGFITLSKIILGQQVSLESANAHFKKLNDHLPAFTPDEIIKLSDGDMRNCQISRQKSGYLRSLSNAIINGDVDFNKLSGMQNSDVKDKLKMIRGIGDWTADIYLMFCLQAKDVFPIEDIAVTTTIKELTKVAIKDEIISLSEKWKPNRSLAAFFLWHYYLNKRNRNAII